MKQYFKYMTVMAALLFTVVGAWAEQTVNVVYKNAGRGTVTAAVANGICTLTAKPAEGYCLTAENLSAVTIVDGGQAQAPRRAPGIGSAVTVSAVDATADPSGVTTYTLSMPTDENLGVEVTADFQQRTSIAEAAIADVDSRVYNGEAYTPALTVVLGTTTLVPDTDYTVAYADNVNAGTATATVTGIGFYTGTVKKEFTIDKADHDMSGVTFADGTFTYDGQPHSLSVSGTLPEGVTVTYSENNELTAVGSVTVTATFAVADAANYNVPAAMTATLTVTPAAGELTVTLAEAGAAFTYTGTAHTPAVVVKSGETELSAETDYDAAYTDNVNVGTATVTVTGKGNYDGARGTLTFVIDKADVTLSFATERVALDVSEGTYQQAVTASVEGLSYQWISSNETVATVDADGQVTLKAIGEATITATFEGTDNYNAAEASYVISLERSYGFAVNGVMVTESNHADVLNDGTVFFDTNSRLVLKQAELTAITLQQENTLTEDMTIELVGENTLTADQPAIVNQGKPLTLTLTTSGAEPGSLIYRMASATLTSAEQAFVGFSSVACENKLALTLTDNEDGSKTVYVKVSLQPIVNDSTEENKTTDIDYSLDTEVTTEQLTNVVIDNVLYTLNDTQTAGAADDGFVTDYDGLVVLNSTVSDEELEAAMQMEPGTQEYAETFKGITFTIPQGTGFIEITSFEEEGHALCVKVGKEEPVMLSHKEMAKDTIPYAITALNYVYVYHVEQAVAQGGRRIGPKTTVSTGLKGLQVSANEIDTPPVTTANYKMLTAESLSIEGVGMGEGLVVDDNTVTDLDEDVFNFMRPSQTQSASRRATAAVSDVPFIDLRGTSLVGKEVNRSEGIFRQIPENTFIYMPAGNTSASPNVIIGSVCEDMQLTGGSTGTYKQVANFTAAKAAYTHAVDAGGRTTLYLPFAVSQAETDATFYEYGGMEGEQVLMNVVTDGVKPNVPYIVKAGDSGITTFTARNAEVKCVTETEDGAFVGTYKKVTANGAASIYRYVDSGDSYLFERLGTGESISPFTAYLKGDGSSQYTVKWSDEEEVHTGISNLQMLPTIHDEWYTLDGSKLSGEPSKKGIYIHNGQKVVKE